MPYQGPSECAEKIATAIASSSSPSGLDYFNAVMTVVIALLSAAIAWRVFSFDRSRALRADREQLRGNLRLWFQTLSRSAPWALRNSSGRLRSECEEIADAERQTAILTLMIWAPAMLQESYDQIGRTGFTDDEGHQRRIIIKRRFRQLIAVWSRRPWRGGRLIQQYTSRGWPAVMGEPIDAASSAQFLAPKQQWKRLPEVWNVPG
jgi:hypothetical protein